MTCSGQDLVPVSQLARFEFCVFVRTAEVKDFKQFVAWPKANPDQATFAVPRNGTIPHFWPCTHKLIMSAWLNGHICWKNCRKVSVPGTHVPC